MKFGRTARAELPSLLALIALVAVVATPAVRAAGNEKPQPDPGRHEIPEGKQTPLGLYVTAAEAYAKWKDDPAHVKILDVRTTDEFIFVGHAEMAWNIPFASQTRAWDSTHNRFAMELAPDFLSSAKEVFSPEDTLLVMCRSGGRSAMAVNLLATAGFKNVYNIIDGMEGDLVHDPDSVHHGKRMKNGWKNSGAPWTYELDPERIEGAIIHE